MRLIDIKKLIDKYDSTLAWWSVRFFKADPTPIKQLRELHLEGLTKLSKNIDSDEYKFDPVNDVILLKLYNILFQVEKNMSNVSLLTDIFQNDLAQLENDTDRQFKQRLRELKSKDCFFPDKFFTNEVLAISGSDIAAVIRYLPIELFIPEILNSFYLCIEKNDAGSFFWLERLYKSFKNIFTTENIKAIIEEPDLQSFMHLSLPSTLITQANFDSYRNHVDILCYCVGQINTIPQHLFTQAVFDRIIAICVTANEDDYKAIEDLQTYVEFARTPPNDPSQRYFIFNINNNTHAESVHISVSESAIKLYQTYEFEIDTDKKLSRIFTEIRAWEKGLSSQNVTGVHAKYVEPAKRAINQLLNTQDIHIDPVSMINTKQLLAMVWLGINDLNKLANANTSKIDPNTILQNAKKHLIEGLYDIQRGFNNNDRFQDNNADEDGVICPPGIFNKLAQVLWFCEHVDVDIQYYTHETVREKCQALVKEEVLKYLLLLNNEAGHSDTAKQQLIDLKQKIKNEFLLPQAIGDAIKEKIVISLLDEFKLLYRRRERDPRFIKLLSDVKTIDVSNVLEKFERQVSVSEQKEIPSHISLSVGLR